MIRARNIRKSFGSLEVLKGIDLDIDEAEVVSITGRSGAGKSTLLHILGTLDTMDEGSLVIDNIDISSLSGNSIAEFRNKTIGFVFQFHHLLPEFTALENVFIPALISNADKSTAQKRAKELLDYMGLAERTSHKPNQLSGGEQQRVAMARALMNEPKIIFADEPTGNLDSSTSAQLHGLLFDLRKDFNQTFVIVTHNKELAGKSDRTIDMEDGRIVI